MSRIAVAGAGLSGAVIAHELAEAGHDVEVFETRNHVAGNCYTERDKSTGIMVQKFGPHIFHTNNVRAWNYVRQLRRIHAVPPSRASGCRRQGLYVTDQFAHDQSVLRLQLFAARGAELHRRSGGQDNRDAAQLRGASSQVRRPRTVRGILPGLHDQAVGPRSYRTARKHPGKTSFALQL